MSDIVFELNSAGVEELLKSGEMREILQGYADQVQSRCTAGHVGTEEYGVSVKNAGSRLVAKVYPKTPHARNSNRVHKTLQKALWG